MSPNLFNRIVPATLIWVVVATGAEIETNRAVTTQVRQWVSDLDNESFAARESAAAKLSAFGGQAVPLLAQGVLSDNAEVAWRCSEILQHIAMEGDEPTLNRVTLLMHDLSKRGKPSLEKVAIELRVRQKTFRHDRAAAEIRKFGGQVAAAENEDMSDAMEFDGAVPIMELDFAFDDDEMEMEGPDFEPGGIQIGEAFGAEEAELEGFEAEAPLAKRIAEALLPGPIGRAMGRVFGGGDFQPLANFRLPDLEEADDYEFDAMEFVETFPGEEMGERDEAEVVAVVAMDAAFAAPPMFGFGIELAGEVPAGMMWLSGEWQGADAGLEHVGDLKEISSLQIDGAKITDAALAHIAKMGSLQHLQIRNVGLSREALRAFHKQRPNVSIMALGTGMMGVNSSGGGKGCVLDTVFPGSAAHEAGLQSGDEVVAIDGDSIRDFSELTISVFSHKPGDTLKVNYNRSGEKRETNVKLKARVAQ